MNKIPMLERFAAQSLVEHDGELIFSKEKFALLIVGECLLSLEPDLYSEEIDYEFEQRFYKRCREKIVKHFGVEE
jgi:hypothetical protein